LLSVIIPTLNAAQRLPLCLDALVAPAVHGLINEVIIVDGGSTDETVTIADGFGAKILTAPPGRGGQLAAGGAAARGEWLLFLHGDTVLDEAWGQEARCFIEKNIYAAGVFRLAFDAKGLAPKIVAAGAAMRTKILKSPYGDQGLLIAKRTYDQIGGFSDMPLFEDVDMIDRLVKVYGSKALWVLNARATTSPVRYERDGYIRRVVRNIVLLTRFRLGATQEKLVRRYHS